MKVAIYARVSTEKQEKEETINSQLEALREYTKSNAYVVYEEYIDEGYSGELLDRPALDRLRDDAKNKLFDLVLVHSPDRLSRKFIGLGLIQEELKKSEVAVTFLNRPDSKDTPEDNLLNGVQGLIAEYEKAKILERTRRGKMHKAKSNNLVGGLSPYGYRYIKGDRNKNISGYYEIIEQEAKIVRLIFDLFVNKKLSIRAIAKELTNRGIPPKKGKHWRTSSLHRIIRNETYAGVAYYNKHISVETDNHKNGNKYRRVKNTGRRLRPRDQWVPITLPESAKIIDKQMFDLAQMQLKKNSELSPRNVKNRYLLRGLVKCAGCDSPFYGTPCHRKLYYRCGNRSKTFPLPKECSMPMVKTEVLDKIVWSKFCEAIKNPALITKQLTKLKEKTVKNESNITKDIELLDQEIEDASIKENRLLDAYRENIITKEQLKEQMIKIREKKALLQKEKQGLVSKQENAFSSSLAKRTIQDYCNQIERRLDSLDNDFEGRRYLLSLALNKIVLDGKTVKIKGIIPIINQESNPSCNIASTTSGYCACRLPRLQLPVWQNIGPLLQKNQHYNPNSA